jgi:hypothetical protein
MIEEASKPTNKRRDENYRFFCGKHCTLSVSPD